MRAGPAGHAHASPGGRGGRGGAGRHGRGRHRRGHRRRHGFSPYYSYGYGYPWWYYGYPYDGYGEGDTGDQIPETCCFDEVKQTLYCPGTEYDGAPAFAMQTSVYEGRKMAFVSSPSFREDRWIWLCPEQQPEAVARRANPCFPTRSRVQNLLHRAMNPDTPAAAAQQETGAPPLEAELPAQAGMQPTPSPVPHAGRLPGNYCAPHPSIPDLVCCSDGIYAKPTYCVQVPQAV